jgi:hypothetical protein
MSFRPAYASASAAASTGIKVGHDAPIGELVPPTSVVAEGLLTVKAEKSTLGKHLWLERYWLIVPDDLTLRRYENRASAAADACKPSHAYDLTRVSDIGDVVDENGRHDYRIEVDFVDGFRLSVTAPTSEDKARWLRGLLASCPAVFERIMRRPFPSYTLPTPRATPRAATAGDATPSAGSGRTPPPAPPARARPAPPTKGGEATSGPGGEEQTPARVDTHPPSQGSRAPSPAPGARDSSVAPPPSPATSSLSQEAVEALAGQISQANRDGFAQLSAFVETVANEARESAISSVSADIARVEQAIADVAIASTQRLSDLLAGQDVVKVGLAHRTQGLLEETTRTHAAVAALTAAHADGLGELRDLAGVSRRAREAAVESEIEIKRVAADLSAARTEIGHVADLSDEVRSASISVAVQSARVAEALPALGAEVHTAGKHVHALAEAVAHVTERVKGATDRLAGVEARSADVADRSHRVEGAVDAVRASVGALEASSRQSVESAASALSAQILRFSDDTVERLSSLQAAIEGVGVHQSAHAASVSAALQAGRSSQEALASAVTDFLRVREGSDAVATMREVRARQETIASSIAALELANAQAVGAAERALEATMHAAITPAVVESVVQALLPRLVQAVGGGVGEEVRALRERVGGLEGKVDALTSLLSRVDATLSTMSATPILSALLTAQPSAQAVAAAVNSGNGLGGMPGSPVAATPGPARGSMNPLSSPLPKGVTADALLTPLDAGRGSAGAGSGVGVGGTPGSGSEVGSAATTPGMDASSLINQMRALRLQAVQLQGELSRVTGVPSVLVSRLPESVRRDNPEVAALLAKLGAVEDAIVDTRRAMASAAAAPYGTSALALSR